MSEVILEIDGQRWGGWQSVTITRSLETMAAQFSLSLTDRWAADQAPRPIRPFQHCRVLIDGDTVITGIIDEVQPGYDMDTHSVSVTGRSLTGQLADCAAGVPTGEMSGLSLAAAARRLIDPFGINVIDLANAAGSFDRIEIEPGETVAEILERLALQRGVFLTDDPQGNLVITRRSERRQGRIELGGNARGCEATLSGVEQFSTYEVKGQTEGSDLWSGPVSASPSGSASDASVPLYRPMVILSETQGDATALRKRAVFEAALRRGRARQWVYELTGWRVDSWTLWEDNTLVTVRDDFMGLDDLLLIISVELSLSEEGFRARITVAPPEGYDLLAIPEQKPEATGWTGENP